MAPAVCVPALGVVLACVLACSPARVRYEEQLEEAPRAVRHGVHGERLDELMRGLDRLRNERLPQEMDVAAARGWRAGIAAVARDLALAAERIPAADRVPPGVTDRAAFLELARSLRDRALRLEASAPGASPAELQGLLSDVDRTCARCHRLFRDADPHDGP